MSIFAQNLRLKPGQIGQAPTQTSDQQALISRLLQGLGGPLGSGLQNLQNILGGGQEAFEAFQRPAMRQFEEQVIPGIAERFAEAGGLSSSGFQQSLGQAGQRLSENLSEQRAGLQNQALSQLMQFLGMSQQPQFENIYQPTGPSFGASFGQGLGQGLGEIPGMFAGGAASSAGGAFGQLLKRLMSRGQ